MGTSLLLAKKILEFFMMILMGFLIVKVGLLRSEDSKPLSVLSIHVIVPCVIVNAFRVELTQDIVRDFLLALLAAFAVHVSFLILVTALRKWTGLDPVEGFSVMYTNSGNLILPLIAGILGEEWQMFCVAFIIVQNLFAWTHGKAMLCGEARLDLVGMMKNVNIIAIMIGIVLFTLRIPLPEMIGGSLHAVSLTVGPIAMFVTGMLMAGLDWNRVRLYRRTWWIVLLRMVLASAVALCICKFTPLGSLAPHGSQILMITLFSSVAPSASATPMMAQAFGQDAYYASVINIATLLVSVVTMPVMTALYTL